MKLKNTIPTVILIIGLSILFLGNSRNVVNQRVDQNPPVTSKLKDRSTENLETLSAKITDLQTEVLVDSEQPESREVNTGDSITVNYRGWLAETGVIFDQSFNRGDDGFTFTVGQGVIQGWSQGVVGMKIGEIRRLKIPSALGYGEQGSGETIPGNADLIFDVELLSFES
jgi:FKBP-type peptidyl-prolyl cis-trans isomerase